MKIDSQGSEAVCDMVTWFSNIGIEALDQHVDVNLGFVETDKGIRKSRGKIDIFRSGEGARDAVAPELVLNGDSELAKIVFVVDQGVEVVSEILWGLRS